MQVLVPLPRCKPTQTTAAPLRILLSPDGKKADRPSAAVITECLSPEPQLGIAIDSANFCGEVDRMGIVAEVLS